MAYSSDLNDKQWEILKPLVPKTLPGGRPPKYDRRDLLNAIFYMNSNGVKWRDLPKDYPHWCSVYKFFKLLRDLGIWEKINLHLVKMARKSQDRNEDPTLICVDSQSVKGDCVNKDSGFDGNKKVKGVKRHIFVDVLGLIIACVVTTANTSDIKAGRILLKSTIEKGYIPCVEKILGDSAYQSLCENQKIELEISTKDASIKSFVPLRIRWKVERSFAWLGRKRRLNRNYERDLNNHLQFVFIANIKQALSLI